MYLARTQLAPLRCALPYPRNQVFGSPGQPVIFIAPRHQAIHAGSIRQADRIAASAPARISCERRPEQRILARERRSPVRRLAMQPRLGHVYIAIDNRSKLRHLGVA